MKRDFTFHINSNKVKLRKDGVLKLQGTELAHC